MEQKPEIEIQESLPKEVSKEKEAEKKDKGQSAVTDEEKDDLYKKDPKRYWDN